MSAEERLRLKVLVAIGGGTISLKDGALRLGISYRQMRRVRSRHDREGDVGVVHRLRGKASNRRTPEAVRQEALALCRGKYAGFGPTLASEYLVNDGPVLSHDTVRRLLLSEGLLPGRRGRGKHRSRRERRARLGEMVQMDGSWHDWFEGRGSWCCLMVMIDDATGRVFARFYERETLSAAFNVFKRYALRHGLPVCLYVDRSGIYRSEKEPTIEQELAGERPLTQFGRGMKQLDVNLILANSPQAKGRVERVNGTLQDRLVKAMRLADIREIAAANYLLEDSFLETFNQRFSVPSAEEGDAHREAGGELDAVLCEHHRRRVGQDWCVQWKGTLLQIDKKHEALNLAGKYLNVQEMADQRVRLLWEEKSLIFCLVKQRPVKAKAKPMIKNNKRWLPSEKHPWKTEGKASSASSPTAPQHLKP